MSSLLRGPHHRTILALDLERSTARTNVVKIELRYQLYHLLQEALQVAEIDEKHCEPIADRGDGVLLLIHPVDEVPKSRLLTPLIPTLSRLLTEHNAALPEEQRAERELRMRVVVHAGDLLRDAHGSFGLELDAAIRLLDADAVRRCLRETSAPLVVVVSQMIYESIVIHGYDGIQPDSYRRGVEVRVGGLTRHGYLHVPSCTASTTPFTAA
ncbi:hypothetical protein [Spirillospora sp. NPDC047279]|uniref:hypothetical protein n=1 Tax=Spirillospora sp. NPDC047279 TaxID=3155478 RepID=UPI0033C091FE